MMNIEKEEQQWKHGALAWMAGNPVAANLAMLVLLLGGLLSGYLIKQEVFPAYDRDQVEVTVAYPGASPAEVEQGIVLAIEEAVRGLDGVDKVTSHAVEGQGRVTVFMMTGYDLQKLANDVQREVDRITSFPEDAEEPQVTVSTRKRQVISVVVYGDVGDTALREEVEMIRDRLLQDPHITHITLSGARPYEMAIEIPEEKLRAYGLTLQDVADRVRRTALELPGGGIKTTGGEVLIRMKERRDYGREFEDIALVSLADGTEVTIGDLGRVKDEFAETDYSATFNNQPAIQLNVYRVGKQTPIEVADAVKRHVETLRAILPTGVHIDTWADFSEIYRQRMTLLLHNGYIGLVLVFVLLGIFLEMRLAFWVTMGIPVSFLGSLLFLPYFGQSINMVSLFAFIIALGIVVDDAIVVGENVYDYHQRGYPFLEAAKRGVRGVALPVTFSILTNIAAFLPLMFLTGMVGKMFRVIPIVVITVFLLSLAESLFILPAHLGHQKDRVRHGLMGRIHRRQQRFSHWFSHLIRDRYGPLLARMLMWRYLTVAIGVFILIITLGFVMSGRMGFSLFPRIEADFAVGTVVLPFGVPVERSKQVRDQLIHAAMSVADECGGTNLVEGCFAAVGGYGGGAWGSHVVEVYVMLTDPDTRPIHTAEFTKRWRKATGPVIGAEAVKFAADAVGPGHGLALTVELAHRDTKVLEAAAAELADALAFFPNVKDIDRGFSPGKQQIDFTLLPEGESVGLTVAEVARQVRNAYYGAEALRQQRGRNELKVKVRWPRAQRESEYFLDNMILETPSHGEIPLREAVRMKRGRAYTHIDRRNGRRVATVAADVLPQSRAGQVIEELKQTTLPELCGKYAGLTYSFEGKQADIKESMSGLWMGFALAMLMVYGLLAIPFKSYIQPMIVMVSVPFGLVGAVLGHIIMGYSLSVMSMFGIVALSGVVVNDSLVLIDYANRRRREDGATPIEAITSAAIRRFRPIMLTTLTTFGGLAPIIFEKSVQARFLIPMAISLGFGILFATLITLALVPALYLVIEDIRRCLFGRNVAIRAQE